VSEHKDLRGLVLEMAADIDYRTALFVELDELTGFEPEDAAWFADALASRSVGHAAQVVSAVVRLSTAARDERGTRRIEERIAALAEEHSPPDGWEQRVLDMASFQEQAEQRTSLWRRLWRRVVRRR
jgi:hypothetical protein